MPSGKTALDFKKDKIIAFHLIGLNNNAIAKNVGRCH